MGGGGDGARLVEGDTALAGGEDEAEGIRAEVGDERGMIGLCQAADLDEWAGGISEEAGSCSAGRGSEFAGFRDGVGGAHERFASEDGIGTPAAGAGGAECVG